MAKVLYNVGTFVGLNGTAVMYTAESATGGSQFLVYKTKVGADPEEWSFMSRSAFDGHMASGVGTISSAVKFDSLLDVAPTGTLDEDGYVIIDNDNSLPRLFVSQPFFSLKGTGVPVYDGDTGKQVTGDAASRNGSGTVVINSNAKTLTESIKEGVDWLIKNPFITAAIALGISELLGWTNFLGLKKKRPTRRRR